MRAIDFHVHLSTVEWMVDSLGPLQEATERHFRTEVADPHGRRDGRRVPRRRRARRAARLGRRDARWACPRVTNDFVAECVRRHPDAFVGLRLGRPVEGQGGASTSCGGPSTDLGLRGLKLHPSAQGFAPNERRVLRPLCAVAVELGVPVMFHTGTTGLGAGVPGGGGIKLGYSRPDPARRRGGRLPRAPDHRRAPIVALAGRDAGRRPAQDQRVDRPVGLVAPPLVARADRGGARAAAGSRACSAPTTRSSASRSGSTRSAAHEPSAEVEEKVLRENARRLLGV